MEAQRPAPPAVPIRIFFLGIPTRVMLLGGIVFADQPHRRSGKIRGHGEMLEISILPKCFTHLDSGLSGLWTIKSRAVIGLPELFVAAALRRLCVVGREGCMVLPPFGAIPNISLRYVPELLHYRVPRVGAASLLSRRSKSLGRIAVPSDRSMQKFLILRR